VLVEYNEEYLPSTSSLAAVIVSCIPEDIKIPTFIKVFVDVFKY